MLASASEIPPGGEGEIRVTYSTELDVGKKVKSFRVFSNARSSLVRLELVADIKAALICEPGILEFGKMSSTETGTLEATIGGYAFGKLKILRVLSENPKIIAQLVNEGRSLRVTLLPGLKVGRINERLKFVTDSKTMPLLRAVTVAVRITGPLKLSRTLVDFADVEAGKVQEEVLEINSNGPAFKISKAEVSNSAVTARLEVKADGRGYKLFLLASENFKHARVTLFTDLPEQPRLEVSLFGKARK